MLKIAKVFMALLFVFVVVGVSSAQPPTPFKPIPTDIFKPVDIPRVENILLEPRYDVINYATPIPSASPEVRKAAKLEVKPKVETKVEPKEVAPTRQAVPKSSILKGTATWYCVQGVSRCTRGYSGGMYAAAGSEVRNALGPKWRGKYVTVSSGGNAVRVKLIDWCACKGARVIDLYGDAFRRLAPLSRGVITVKISR